MAPHQFFAPCPRGLEPVLAAELAELAATEIQPVEGGIHFRGDWAACYRANLESRIASRVLWKLAQARYSSENDVYQAAYALPWNDWFSAGDTIRVNVSAVRCPLRSIEFVTLRIKDAVCDKFRATSGQRPSVDTQAPRVRIHAFLDAQEISLYLDTSGEPLFKRGYRKASTEAPLRENLAAGILRPPGGRLNAAADPQAAAAPFCWRRRRWRWESRPAGEETLRLKDSRPWTTPPGIGYGAKPSKSRQPSPRSRSTAATFTAKC